MGPRAADRLRKAIKFNGGERVSDSSVKLSVPSNVRSSGLFALHGRRHEVTARFAVRLCWGVRAPSHPKTRHRPHRTRRVRLPEYCPQSSNFYVTNPAIATISLYWRV